MRRLNLPRQLLSQIALALASLFVLLPIWGMLRLAFDAALKGAPVTFRAWPELFSLEAFRQVWHSPAQSLSFLGLLRNSLLVSGGAALISVFLGASMAYAFARFRFPGRRSGLFALLLGTLLPPVALMTPLYILLTILGIRASLLGLMVVYTAFAMPFCVWNMRAAFQAVPRELEESAFLEGATPWIAFRRITLPLALPSIAVAGLMAFLVGYTEFAIGWLFVERGENVTLAMAVSGMLGNSVPWSHVSALAVLMSLPVILAFLLLQRYLMRGLLLGQVAGDE
ncbi:MAG: carbohydrate ABC transporter permease [Anaerolineae bacterium]|jgi:arabinogalactan oligomer/maltooligosaccharide transport system permease protein